MNESLWAHRSVTFWLVDQSDTETDSTFFLCFTHLFASRSLRFSMVGILHWMLWAWPFFRAADSHPLPLISSLILYHVHSLSVCSPYFCSLLSFPPQLSAYVSANTERLVALETFEHLQRLSLQFHLKRETGSVLRSVSRGASSFASLMRVVLFQILPVLVQVLVVCIYLLLKYNWYYAVVTAGVIILYFTFTFTTTDWRDKYRRIMNQKDNEFNQKVKRWHKWTKTTTTTSSITVKNKPLMKQSFAHSTNLGG